MAYTELDVPDNGRLSFSLRVDTTRPWWRDLDLDGQPLYRIGNLCGTCEAIMEKFEDAKFPIAPSELSLLLRNGLETVSQPILDTISQILPKGKYVVSVLEVQPGLVKVNPSDSRYLWLNTNAPRVPDDVLPAADRIFPLWWIQQKAVHFPKFDQNALYEALLPLVEDKQLSREVIETYKTQIEAGQHPMALAFSVVDVRYPSGRGYVEWQLVHFLLDGHHKVTAACELNRPIKVLSFLSLDESFASKEWVDHTIKLRYEA
jgi:hypothetical protein